MNMEEKQHNNTKLMLLHRFFSFLSVYRTKSNPIMSGQMQIVCATALQPYDFKIQFKYLGVHATFQCKFNKIKSLSYK